MRDSLISCTKVERSESIVSAVLGSSVPEEGAAILLSQPGLHSPLSSQHSNRRTLPSGSCCCLSFDLLAVLPGCICLSLAPLRDCLLFQVFFCLPSIT
ncbi:uncharacterized protein BJX67DRAFT_268738 [Aspergillus lucknowensis]|uniref:Uncharacterized protein n=1 Tax=Aspergillus lucknowensis TaxID=176173 RepID=A0ABR4LES3_9EURO